MTDNDKLSKIEKRADEMLEGHNGLYLEKRLYSNLKKEFPDLSRSDFRDVLHKLLEEDYVLEHGLIRPQTDKKTKRPKKYVDDTKPGKGASETQRIPDKRI